MAKVIYEGVAFALDTNESVLDGLLRAGVNVAHSCKAGSCGSCLMRALTPEALPAASQAGLKDAWKASGYFLACVCKPETDMEAAPVDAALRVAARIESIEWLSPTVLRVRLAMEAPFDFRAGQYVTLFRNDGLARSYSIASLPVEGLLELHVRVLANGRMSQWLATEAQRGDTLQVQGPAGECFYLPGREEQPLLLAGTGTGLAPLYGIARDALAQGHRGPIHLFHGAAQASGLYLGDQLRALAAAHGNLSYTPTLLDEHGPIDQAVLMQIPKTAGWRAFLCGDPAIVQSLRKKLFLAGASLNDIHADAFLPSV